MSISGLGRVACLLQGAAKGRGSLPPSLGLELLFGI